MIRKGHLTSEGQQWQLLVSQTFRKVNFKLSFIVCLGIRWSVDSENSNTTKRREIICNAMS